MDDTDLVRQARGGDKAAFGILVERHQARIHATLARMTGDSDLAMDLSQDAFVRAWERLDRFEERSAFSTWLYRIAVRLAYDSLSRRRRTVDVEIDASLPDSGEPAADERLVAEATAADLRRRIEALPDLQRAVVVMRAWDGLPYREIAEIMDTTETSARVSFHYAIRRLREGLTEATSR
ncbi:MAG TPA: sigma-70 family RNA polymerase sigma factor [Gemmatimonadota bacterium]|nr:sigma-70 family RNA polymerase sigma factor [Gemmatimonadota bacterium]